VFLAVRALERQRRRARGFCKPGGTAIARGRAPSPRPPSQRCSEVSRHRREGLVGQFVPAHQSHRPHRHRRYDRGCLAGRRAARRAEQSTRWTSNIWRRSPNRTERRTMAEYSELTPVTSSPAFSAAGRRRCCSGSCVRRTCAMSPFWSTNSAKSDSIIICCRAWPRARCCSATAALCCAVRGDLQRALRDLFVPADARRCAVLSPGGDRDIGIGRSGADRVHAVVGSHSSSSFPVVGIVTTVDAVNGASQLDRFPESVKQASMADRMVMTKADLADEETMAALRQWLRRLNVSAQILESREVGGDFSQLLTDDIYDAAGKSREASHWVAEEVDEHATHSHNRRRAILRRHFR